MIDLRNYPRLHGLLKDYRWQSSGSSFQLLALGLLCTFLISRPRIFAGKEWWQVVMIIVLTVGALGAAVVGLYRRSRMRVERLLEENASRYGSPSEVIEQLESELASPLLADSRGTITANWLIASEFEHDYIFWPHEPIKEVDYQPKQRRTPRQLFIEFESGKRLLLTNDEDEAAEILDLLEAEIPNVPLSPRARIYFER